jgi:hypothetical protein
VIQNQRRFRVMTHLLRFGLRLHARIDHARYALSTYALFI